jgi:hypothetical protein
MQSSGLGISTKLPQIDGHPYLPHRAFLNTSHPGTGQVNQAGISTASEICFAQKSFFVHECGEPGGHISPFDRCKRPGAVYF